MHERVHRPSLIRQAATTFLNRLGQVNKVLLPFLRQLIPHLLQNASSDADSHTLLLLLWKRIQASLGFPAKNVVNLQCEEIARLRAEVDAISRGTRTTPITKDLLIKPGRNELEHSQ